LLVGFGLYFAGWHSLSSILEQVAFFQTKNPAYKWQQYLRQVMPYTLLAVFGMLAVWGAQESLSVGAHIGLLFLGISLVTLPHMILIELLYAQQPQGAI
jgi:Brp/Blh family beta-carotene 15,15'-monooxygenase